MAFFYLPNCLIDQVGTSMAWQRDLSKNCPHFHSFATRLPLFISDISTYYYQLQLSFSYQTFSMTLHPPRYRLGLYRFSFGNCLMRTGYLNRSTWTGWEMNQVCYWWWLSRLLAWWTYWWIHISNCSCTADSQRAVLGYSKSKGWSWWTQCPWGIPSAFSRIVSVFTQVSCCQPLVNYVSPILCFDNQLIISWNRW